MYKYSKDTEDGEDDRPDADEGSDDSDDVGGVSRVDLEGRDRVKDAVDGAAEEEESSSDLVDWIRIVLLQNNRI